MKVKKITARSLLTKTKLPDVDYVINPYVGCQFGCMYCYASFMGRFVNEPNNNWGHYVYAKVNALEVLDKEITRLKKRQPNARVLLSSVTDPYHAPESEYQLTRNILNLFLKQQYPGLISILTKSPSVLRDLDILKELQNVEIGFTVTTTDDGLSRFLEKKAPVSSRRLEALYKLNQIGLKTYAFVGPLLPHLYHQQDKLEAIFSKLANVGVNSVFVEHMNLSPYIKSRLLNELMNQGNKELVTFYQAPLEPYKVKLEKVIENLAAKYQMSLRLNRIIDHKD